jgi:hypothetical protein
LNSAFSIRFAGFNFCCSWITQPDWKKCLSDGLHLNALGYGLLFKEFMRVLEERWPTQLYVAPLPAPGSKPVFPDMPMHFLPFDHIDPARPQAAFNTSS